MSKLLETLKEAGWVETTLGECEDGEQVVTNDPYSHIVGAVRERDPKGNAHIGFRGLYRGSTPVLRAPRPEPGHPEGTVVRGVADGMETNLIWIGHDTWSATEGYYSPDEVQVLRVIAHPDGTTPAPEAPVWDVERRYPVGTVVESDVTGRRVVYVADGDLPSMRPWSSPGCVPSWNSDDLAGVRVLFTPEEQEEDQ